MDKKDMKIQALLERMSTDKAKYEEEIANLRVEYTALSQEYQDLQTRYDESHADGTKTDSEDVPPYVPQEED